MRRGLNERNPRNNASELFKKLTRLFSGPIIDYRRQAERSVKNRSILKYGKKFNDISGQSFKKSQYNPFDQLRIQAMQNHQRAQRYFEFEQMEFDPILASALDIYADEMTTSSDLQPLLKIDCANAEIREVLEVLYKNIMGLDFNLFGWCRTVCKFGDLFLYLDIDEKNGVTNVIALPTAEVERLEGEDEENPNYIIFQWNTGQLTFENWQIAHMRILGNDKFIPYGTSVLDPARRIWRQLCYSKNTKVWVKNFGYKEIQYIEPGDTVLSFDKIEEKFVETKVKHVAKMGKQSLVEIQTAHRKLKVTPDHGIYVKTKNGSIVEKQAKDLIVSNGRGGWDSVRADKLILSNRWEIEDEGIIVKIPDSFYEGRDKIRNLFLNERRFSTSPEFLRLLGFMCGDGWVNENNLGFALGIEEEQNNYYIKLFEKLFNLKNFNIREAKKNSGGIVKFNSKEICELFRAVNFKTGVFNKRIPNWVFSLNQENKVEFLRGYMDADGSWGDGRLSSSNRELLDGARILAQQAGVDVGNEIKLDREKGVYKDNTFEKINRNEDSYRLYINLDNIKTEEVSYETVCRVVSVGEDDTYDLQVEHKSHNFVSEGVVASNTLLEDAMMAYRITRAPERRVFYVDVGSIAADDVEQFMQAMMTNLKRNQVVDPDTGRVDLRYNPMSVEEDYWIPVRAGTNTKVENLPGGAYTGDIDDVKYLRDKLFSAIKIPQSYLSRGDGADEDKTTLAQKDIRFARTIQRIQRAVVAELEQIGRVHLFILGYRGKDLLSYKLSLNNPSKIAELQELEHWRTKFDVASAATEGHFSRRWISQKLFGQSAEEFLRIQREMYYDRMLDASLAAIEEGGGQEGGMGGDLGGGESDFGDDGIGDEEIGDMESEDTGEEETLLAAPAKRDDEYTTPGAHGKKYRRVTTDKRNMGARKRSYQGAYSKEMASATSRNIYKGKGELSSLARGIFEEIETNYNNDEKPKMLEAKAQETEIFAIDKMLRGLTTAALTKKLKSNRIILENTDKSGKDKNEK